MDFLTVKIVVVVRCYNEIKNIERFMKGYDFADIIVVSDGGSTDGSIGLLNTYPKVKLFHFHQQEVMEDEIWNPDATHINFVLNWGKTYDPDWLFFDDMDCVPNLELRRNDVVRWITKISDKPQLNAFRLYMWGDKEYFPEMNRNFSDPRFTSLWAWKPKELDIRADESLRHGTMIGLTEDFHAILPPMCLLHKSWHPDTIESKMKRYNTLGLNMNHPLTFAGVPELLPSWAVEE